MGAGYHVLFSGWMGGFMADFHDFSGVELMYLNQGIRYVKIFCGTAT